MRERDEVSLKKAVPAGMKLGKQIGVGADIRGKAMQTVMDAQEHLKHLR